AIPIVLVGAHGAAAARLSTVEGDEMSIKTATLNGVATIEIARPEKKNAITLDMSLAMAAALRHANGDPSVPALLIPGHPGLVPEFASSLVFPRLVGNVRAAEKLLLGEPFGAAEAVELGIANAVLPANELVNHARRMAERFNALPPGAVRETKKLMRRAGAA